MNGYELSRKWFDFAFENNSKITPNHGILFFWLIEINNRLGWAKEFQITAIECMQGMGISKNSYKTYKRCLDDLVEWGFIILIKKSINQYQCNIIAMGLKPKAHTEAQPKALTKALLKHIPKHVPHSKTYKHINKETIESAKDFYKLEIDNNKGGEQIKYYDTFVKYLFGENETKKKLEHILKVPEQLSYEQFSKLWQKVRETDKQFSHYLNIWANNKSYSKRKETIYLTLLNWMNKDIK